MTSAMQNPWCNTANNMSCHQQSGATHPAAGCMHAPRAVQNQRVWPHACLHRPMLTALSAAHSQSSHLQATSVHKHATRATHVAQLGCAGATSTAGCNRRCKRCWVHPTKYTTISDARSLHDPTHHDGQWEAVASAESPRLEPNPSTSQLPPHLCTL